MGSLTLIMDAMADKISDAMEAADETIQVQPRMMLNPTPPSIDIYPAAELRDQVTAGFADLDGGYIFTVRARVTTADNRAGQDTLLRFLDDEDELCIPMALLDDPTLNGVATSVHIVSSSGYTLYPDPGGQGALLGCQFGVLVLKAES
jgi:hypothetical protein